jgi:hypothetical protein
MVVCGVVVVCVDSSWWYVSNNLPKHNPNPSAQEHISGLITHPSSGPPKASLKHIPDTQSTLH